MIETPFSRRLANANRILFLGCGGGFDVFSAIPLALSAVAAGKIVSFGNLSFTNFEGLWIKRVGPSGRIITADAPQRSYFPELHLKRWLDKRGIKAPVYAFLKTGVQPLKQSYEAVFEIEKPDAVVLIDGGTDSLIKGDEADLGTVAEDAVSAVALSLTDVRDQLLACLGFGIDMHHGICHHSFLENTAETIRNGGFLGCLSVVSGTPEGDAIIDLARYVNNAQPALKSIVLNSIADATAGHFGDYHGTARTRGSTLFINPLMSLYWTYDLHTVVKMMAFADAIKDSQTFLDAERAIAVSHAHAMKRDWITLPL